METKLANSYQLDINNKPIKFIFNYLFWSLYKCHLSCEVFMVEISIHLLNRTLLWRPDFDELLKTMKYYDFYLSFLLFVILNLSPAEYWISMIFIIIIVSSISIKYYLSIRIHCFCFHYIDYIGCLMRRYSKHYQLFWWSYLLIRQIIKHFLKI